MKPFVLHLQKLCLFKHLSWPVICYYQTLSYLLLWLCLICLNHNLFEGWDIVHTALPILKTLEASAYLNWLSFLETAQVLILWQVLLGFKETEIKKSEDSLVAQAIKNLPAIIGDPGSTPGLGRSAGQGNGNPLQYSCLKNSMDTGAWWATVHEVTKSQTQLSDW